MFQRKLLILLHHIFHMQEIAIRRILHLNILVLHKISRVRFGRIGQRHPALNALHRLPVVVKILIAHRIGHTVFLQTVDSLLRVFLVPATHLIEMRSMQRHLQVQALHQRRFGHKQALVLLVVALHLLIRHTVCQFLLHQRILISMHNQCPPVRLYQLVYTVVIRYVPLGLVIQQRIFQPVFDILFCKTRTILLTQVHRHYGLKVFAVEEILPHLHHRRLSLMVIRCSASGQQQRKCK